MTETVIRRLKVRGKKTRMDWENVRKSGKMCYGKLRDQQNGGRKVSVPILAFPLFDSLSGSPGFSSLALRVAELN